MTNTTQEPTTAIETILGKLEAMRQNLNQLYDETMKLAQAADQRVKEAPGYEVAKREYQDGETLRCLADNIERHIETLALTIQDTRSQMAEQ